MADPIVISGRLLSWQSNSEFFGIAGQEAACVAVVGDNWKKHAGGARRPITA